MVTVQCVISVRGEPYLTSFVTSELKIKLVCFFTIRPMIWIFIAAKNRCLNLSAVLKFAKTRNEPKQTETKKCNSPLAIMNHDQFFLTMSTIRQLLTIPLLMEEALFTQEFRRQVSFFKYLQEFKLGYQ